MKKRLLELFLALALCMGLAVPAFAVDGGFTIVDGVLLEYIGPGGAVIIPDGVIKIENNAFYMCDNLTKVVISDSVTEIGGGAFGYCLGMTSIAIPNSVTQIGSAAFEHCDALTTVTIPGSVTTLADGAFVLCYGLTAVTICDGVTAIGSNAFFSCENLANVAIPSSVTAIGEDAFKGCGILTIHGEQGSFAEQYAKENSIPFVADGVAPAFTDVAANAYYAAPVSWAVSKGITTGTSATTFNPNDTCTRGQIVTFLYRAMG